MTQKYTLIRKGEPIGEFTLVQLSKKLAEGKNAILEAVRTEKPIGEYTIRKAQTAENLSKKRKAFKEFDWDEIRFRLNPNARR